MRIILTGGGTGGHVIPNLAIIDELRKARLKPGQAGNELMYIGSKRFSAISSEPKRRFSGGTGAGISHRRYFSTGK
ncbi:MAG: glycosyltransferase [Patescibacteria group bacterium]